MQDGRRESLLKPRDWIAGSESRTASRREPTMTIRPLLIAVALLALHLASPASARVRLESICTVHGQKPLRLTGVGLVVGLDGTGDGKGAAPTVEALGRALDLLGNPVAQAALKDANNVAIVMLEAEIPAHSLRVGQRIDVIAASVMSAISLRGGRLLVAPMRLADRRSPTLIATAAGGIAIEDPDHPTTGRISAGAIVEADLFQEQHFLQQVIREVEGRGKVFTLVLDPNHTSFISARSVVDSINADFRELSYGNDVARAAGPGMIEVSIPNAYAEAPVEYIAEVLDIGVDRPYTAARVVVNNASQTVVVSGEVEISPVMVSHPGLAIEIGPGFRALADQQSVANTVQLRTLVGALGQMQVSTQDAIEIIRQINAAGKLHAIYEER